jgi:hypothetical protein
MSSADDGKPQWPSPMTRAAAEPVSEALAILREALNDKCDAYYCPVSGKWLEPKCGYPNCAHCTHRPKNRFDEA